MNDSSMVSCQRRISVMCLDEREDYDLDYAANIFNEHGEFIRHIIKFHVKDEPLVNDLFQEFFLKLASKPLPNNVNNLKNYLYRAITNDIIDDKRQTQRYRERLRQYAHHRKSFVAQQRPDDKIIKSESIDALLSTIEKQLLPSEARAITLRYTEDCDVEEVAENMGIKARSASRYLSVGLSKIRQTFASKQEE